MRVHSAGSVYAVLAVCESQQTCAPLPLILQASDGACRLPQLLLLPLDLLCQVRGAQHFFQEGERLHGVMHLKCLQGVEGGQQNFRNMINFLS